MREARVAVSVMALLAAIGCASRAPAPSAGPPPDTASTLPRRNSITIILPTEVGALSTRLQAVGGNSVPSRFFHEFVNAYLTTRDTSNEVAPWLAQEMPSLDKGTWKVLDNGGMEVTWQLRRGVLWHDGIELTSTDVRFGWEAARNPVTQIGPRGVSALIEAVDTPDPYTAVFRWKQSSQFGNEAGEDQFEILPRRLLEAALLASKDDFPNQQFFVSPELFIGLGPFRPVSWDRGSALTVEAFDRYFLDRPKIDRITFKFIGDSQAATAQLLSGAADIGYQAPAYENAVTISNEWARTGGGTVVMQLNRVRSLHTQFRPEYAKPADLLNLTFRRALIHALDRQAIAEVTAPGTARVADSFSYPDAMGRAIDQAVVRYPYDPNRALGLLADTGWRRGSDGVLVKGGERLSLEYRYAVQADAEALYPVLLQSYQQVGIESTATRYASGQGLQELALAPTFHFSGISATIPALMSRFHGSQIAAPANRYAGNNSQGYQNPEVDRLLDTINALVRVEDRTRLWAQVWHILTEEVAVIPMYYFPSPYVVRAGINGVFPANPVDTPTYGVHTWDVQ